MNIDFDLATLVDLVIGLTLLEFAALGPLRRRLPPRDLLLNLVSGLALMLALRSHVRDAGALAVAGWLAVAGLAHVSDLVRRWRRPISAERATP